MVDYVSLCISNGIDGMCRNSYATIGKDAEGGGLIEQVNAEGAEHHRVIGRARVAANAHRLRSVQGLIDACLHEQLDCRHVKRVLQGVAVRDQTMKA